MTDPAEPATDGAAAVTPRLSVLIPSWNAASSIERAVASVLDERAIALECVVIDDGSTDGTADIVEAMAERDPRVVLIRIPTNDGVSNARNRGLKVARGDWLADLDADDRILPGGIAALMRPTADPDVLAVIGQRIWTDGERTWLSPVYDIPDIREPGRKGIATHPGLLYYASTTGKVFHRSLTEDLWFEGRVLGDQAWTLRALLRAGAHIEVIGETVYEWSRPHPDRLVMTIGTATRTSADRAARMAEVARPVFTSVSAEIDAQIDDAATRQSVKTAYLDRLIRSDLSPPVSEAIDRRDPDTGRLYTVIGSFLASVPPTILASSAFLVPRLLRPPAARWRALDRPGRAGYWAMVRPSLRADPRIASRIGGPLRFPAFALVQWLGEPVGTMAGGVVLSAVGIVRRMLGRSRAS